MKKSLLSTLVACLLGLSSYAQITLEHTFNLNSYFVQNSSGNNQLTSDEVIFSQYLSSGLKYFKINYNLSTIEVYNSDYSFYKNILLPHDSALNGVMHNWYFTDKLFNLDDNIEYIYTYYNYNGSGYEFKIYDDNANLIFSADKCYPIAWDQHFSLNTYSDFIFFSEIDSTFKLGLREYDITNTSTNVKIYSLPGTLPWNMFRNGNISGTPQQDNASSEMRIFPNPSQNTNSILLPKGIKSGEVIVFNQFGQEVKRLTIPQNTEKIDINNTQLPSGTYFYQLQSSDKRFNQAKKVLIIK
jgi:hypothetical protein